MSSHPPRSIHAIDIENILGNPRPACDEAEACRGLYEGLKLVGPNDLLVVGCNHGAAVEVGLGWPGSRLVVGSGPDGADLALLGVLEHERVDERFDRIVIGSGDGIFASNAARLEARGLPVTVVSRPESLSSRLRLAASTVVYFSMPPATPAVLGVVA